MTIFWVDSNTGVILRATSNDGAAPKPDAVAITTPAESGKQVWDFVNQAWSAPPPPPTDAEQTEAEINGSKAWLGLIRVLIDPTFNAQGKTEQQMIDAIKAKL